MKNLLKLKVVILIFSIIFASQAVAADRILPIPKPTVDQETKKKTEKKKEIYPQKNQRKKIMIKLLKILLKIVQKAKLYTLKKNL